jgi:hypothetical protein
MNSSTCSPDRLRGAASDIPGDGVSYGVHVLCYPERGRLLLPGPNPLGLAAGADRMGFPAGECAFIVALAELFVKFRAPVQVSPGSLFFLGMPLKSPLGVTMGVAAEFIYVASLPVNR